MCYVFALHMALLLLAVGFTTISSEPNLCYSETDKCLKVDGDYKCYSPKKVTIDGQPCHDWSKFMNDTYIVENGFEDFFTGLTFQENYCGSSVGEVPWCYTSEVATANWEYCYDPNCYNCDQAFYIPRYKSLSDDYCEYWDVHGEGFAYDYCVNADDRPLGPWCYTGSEEWDYCYKLCDPIDTTQNEDTCSGQFDPEAQCYDPISNCTMNPNQFFGCLDPRSQTLDGEVCSNWNSSSLETWQSEILEKHPTAVLKENQCDIPDGDVRPWCFVGDTWGYCFENCADCRKGYYPRYKTVNGHDCDPWVDHVNDTKVPAGTEFPSRLGANGCYNPDNSRGGSWCFSAAEADGWGYCYKLCPIKCTVPTLEAGVKLYQQTFDGNADYRQKGEKIGIGAYVMEYNCTEEKNVETVNCEANGSLSAYPVFSDKCSG